MIVPYLFHQNQSGIYLYDSFSIVPMTGSYIGMIHDLLSF